jgi:thiamine biosynthesis protein ThiS
MYLMKIVVNGKIVETNDGETLSGIIAVKKLDESKVLASVNKEIVKAESFSKIILAEGDEVELFSFVSGG